MSIYADKPASSIASIIGAIAATILGVLNDFGVSPDMPEHGWRVLSRNITQQIIS